MKLKETQSVKAFDYGFLLKRIFKYIKPVLGRSIVAVLIAIPVGMLDGVAAFSLKPYMDYVVGQKDWVFHFAGSVHTLSWHAFAFLIPFAIVLFAGFQGCLRYLNEYLTTWTTQKITNAVKKDLFAKLVYMEPRFYDDNSSGIIITRYMNDPDTAAKGIIENLKSLMANGFGAIALICVMLYSSWKLALVGVCVLCLAFSPLPFIRKKIKSVSNDQMVVGGDITTIFNETYSGNKVISAYNLSDYQKNHFNNRTDDIFNLTMSLVKRTAWMSPIMYLIASVGIAIVFAYGTKLITTGQMTAGSLASFVTSLLLLYKPIRSLGNTLTGLQGIFVALSRVMELFDVESELKEKENPAEFSNLDGSVKFENVCFEYNENQPVLNNINLEIPKGETLAIVGNSGGGKTTLVNLLPRFYDVKSGSVKFDDVDIRDFSILSLRNNISMVFQDNFLFSGTLRSNIQMGNFDATEDDILNAVKLAHLDEMVADLPDGLDTVIGERGLTLSGGQRQRVAIARAMLRNSQIVILDEATSALDNESEAVVQLALDNLIKNKTVFVIAHRLSTIKNADRIAVINEGSLVELGTHDQLINIPEGHYKHLYEMQFKNQEEVYN